MINYITHLSPQIINNKINFYDITDIIKLKLVSSQKYDYNLLTFLNLDEHGNYYIEIIYNDYANNLYQDGNEKKFLYKLGQFDFKNFDISNFRNFKKLLTEKIKINMFNDLKNLEAEFSKIFCPQDIINDYYNDNFLNYINNLTFKSVFLQKKAILSDNLNLIFIKNESIDDIFIEVTSEYSLDDNSIKNYSKLLNSNLLILNNYTHPLTNNENEKIMNGYNLYTNNKLSKFLTFNIIDFDTLNSIIRMNNIYINDKKKDDTLYDLSKSYSYSTDFKNLYLYIDDH